MLDKAILHKKEKRKPRHVEIRSKVYIPELGRHGTRGWSLSCYVGECPWCTGNDLHATKKNLAKYDKEIYESSHR